METSLELLRKTPLIAGRIVFSLEDWERNLVLQ